MLSHNLVQTSSSICEVKILLGTVSIVMKPFALDRCRYLYGRGEMSFFIKQIWVLDDTDKN